VSTPQKRGPIASLNPTLNTRRAKCLEETEKARMVRGLQQEEVRVAADLMAQREIQDAVRDGARVEVKVKARAKVRVRAKAKAKAGARVRVRVRVRAKAKAKAGVRVRVRVRVRAGDKFCKEDKRRCILCLDLMEQDHRVPAP
jgi:membrane protein involved in colicin uptake